MWYPATVTAAATEVVTIAQARQQARTETDTTLDAELTRLITVARSFVERYCGIRIGAQTIVAKCDSFTDFAHLPDGPVTSLTSISYIDTAGATQTLAPSVYELRADDLDGVVVLKFNQTWPAIQYGSRITVTAATGSDTPPAEVVQAMLLLIGDWFNSHETMMEGRIAQLPFSVDALLTNYRRGL
jgi:uncharacterized phiE125 gp8 family phage protein